MKGLQRNIRDRSSASGPGSAAVAGCTAGLAGLHFLWAEILLLVFLLFASGGTGPAGAEVIIQRTLPATGTNRSEAEWKKPGTPERAAPGAEQEELQRFSGRLIVGGYGSGGAPAGVNAEDWSTDSQLTYGRLMGESGLLELDATAFRKDSIDRFDQRYSGSFRYGGSNLRLALSGDYDEQEVQLAEGLSEEYSGSVNTEFVTSEESLLPVELHHSSSWDDTSGAGGAETEVEARRQERHKIDLAATAPLWASSLELDGYLDVRHDRIDELSTIGYGGTVGVAVPITELLSLSGSVSPGYSASEKQTADELTEETALEYDAGVRLALEDLLEGEVHAALVDTWHSDPNVAGGEQIRDTLWKGRTSWSLTSPAELTSGFAYIVSGKGSTAQGHDISADTGWSSEEGLLRTAKFRGQLVINEATDFTDEIRRWGWNVSAGMMPAEGMALDSSYGGSRREEAGELSIQHNAAGSFSHAPAEVFDYGFGSSYAFTDDELGIVHRLNTNGSMRIQPHIGFRRWEFSVAERFELENRDGANDLFSRSEFSTAVPIARPVSLRYGLGWEWVDYAETGAAEGSAFTHSAGVSVSGRDLPFSLRANYLLGHGYRGLQHQGDVSLELTLAESLNIISELTYRFSETVEYETPFRFSVQLHYEF